MAAQIPTTPVANNTSLPTFKFVHGDDLRRWTPTDPGLTFEGLVAKAVQLYGLSAVDKVQLKYEDTDNDKITLACESDLAELFLLKLPVARVYVTVTPPGRRSKASEAAGKGKVLVADSSSDDEGAKKDTSDDEGAKKDKKWGPKRLSTYLNNLAASLGELDAADEAIGQVVKMLNRGSKNTDAEGQAKVIDCLKTIMAASPRVGTKVELLAHQPSKLDLKDGVPAGVQALAVKALAFGVVTSDQADSQQQELQLVPKAADPCGASSDSENEDGKWRPRRVDKFAAKLSRHMAGLSEDNQAPFQPVRMMLRGAGQTDEDGRAKVLACLTQAAEANTWAKRFLTLLATSPSELGIRRFVMPARALAAEALGLEAPTPAWKKEASSDSENEEGKWRPARVDRYLGRLDDALSAVSDDNQGSFQLVRMLARGANKTDETGRAKVVDHLKSVADSNRPVYALLSKLAKRPHELRMRREIPAPARILAANALGIMPPSGLVGPPGSGSGPVLHRGVSCSICQVKPIAGTRYHSLNRDDFDLCASCYSAMGPQPDDPFTAIERPHCPRGFGGRGFGGGRVKGARGGRGSNKDEKPQVRLVTDVTVPDGTTLAPGQRITKIWRVRNSGDLPWDPLYAGLTLLHVGGDKIGASDATPQCVNGPPATGETVDLTVELVAPSEPGRYEAFFRLARNSQAGETWPLNQASKEPFRFGQRIWARVLVVDPAAGGAAPVSTATAPDATIAGMAGLKILPAEGESHAADTGDWVDVAGAKPAVV